MMDWGSVDWGSVPAWLGAGSLILAYEVFRRDRRNADRSQVDLVGAWGEGEYEIRSPGEAEVVEATIKMHLRNASELPVIVKQLAYEVHTRWFVEDREQKVLRAFEPVNGSEPFRAFVDDVELAPGETKDVTPFPVNLAHLAPEGPRQLWWPGGVTVRVAWLLVIDNASRRWVIRPHRGKRAHRILRRWKPDEFMPRMC